MKGTWILLSLLTCSPSLLAQYRFQSLRFQEDYRHLTYDTADTWYQRLKYSPLGADSSAYISQGGEIRYQYQYFLHEDWGNVPVKDYHSFYTRFLYHTDWHASDQVRVFAQLSSSFAVGRVTGIRSIDQNELALQQIFLDFKPAPSLLIRAGRQEFLYGSQRLIGVREGPNNRQSFDALKLSWKRRSWQIDAYYSHPVALRPGIFNDRIQSRERLWSLYAVKQGLSWLNNLDLYYIGYSNQQKTYSAGSEKETRHSLGFRIWKESDTWKYDLEALYQFGRWGANPIAAYTASLDLSYCFNQWKRKPVLGVKTEIISGEKNGNTSLNTFNPLFPRGAYFGLAAIIGPVNLIDFHPSFSIDVLNNVVLSADYDVFWRYSRQDGLYGPNVALVLPADSQHRFIGQQLGLSLEYQANSFLKISPEALCFIPGSYPKEASAGKTILFAACTLQCRF